MSPLANRTLAFSTAATATINQTANAYQLVNQEYEEAQAAILAATYDTSGFDSSKLQAFLPAKDLAVRTQVLNGLQQYATLLAEISGDQPITNLEAQAAATGSALQKLQQDDFKSFHISSTDKNLAVTAVAALGSALMEHERARALPGILEKMNPPIQQICTILETDIGTVGQPGLASALHRDYDNQIAAEEKFIRDNAATMTAETRRTEIESLPKLVLAQQQSDQALAATSKSLAALAAAHAALAATRTQKTAPAFKLELSEMLQDAQAINTFYGALTATK